MLQALSFIEENSYDVATSLRPDWEQVEQSALERTSEAQTTQDTYPVIADVLRKATGDHSFLLTPDEIAATKSGGTGNSVIHHGGARHSRSEYSCLQ